MGTRSLTIVQDERGADVCVLYRQMDGYPSGHGDALAKYLKAFTVVNGFGLGAKKGKTANGVGCLAAQLVAKFKKDVGGFYLYPAGTRNCGEEYRYIVTVQYGRVAMRCEGGYGDDMRLLYDGLAEDWKASIAEAAEKLIEA